MNYLKEVTGDPPSTWDSLQERVTDDLVTELTTNSDGGAGGTPLFRLTEAKKTSFRGVGRCDKGTMGGGEFFADE